MSAFAFTPPAAAAVPIRGSDRLFPVRRVYCVGRNYAAHAVEMGHDPDREPPFFFQKNPDDLDAGGVLPYPPETADLHHEVELVVALREGGAGIAQDRALDCVFGYAVGLDMTRRDLQETAKRMGRPWEVGKAFARSAPLGPIVPADEIGHPARGRITLAVNGAPRQSGDLDQMIWKTPEIIACLSRLFTLAPGDVIMTGTPSGVGPVVRGDVMEAAIEGVGALTVRVV
jgi:fumarylpyruvate hydrolase